MFELFTLLIYQPFLNVLVFFFWMTDIVTQGHGDMGISVILLTLLIRVMMLPLSIAEHKGEKERWEISEALKDIDARFIDNPVGRDKAKKEVMRSNRGMLIAEVINLSIQVIIALMLYFIFKHGLSGNSNHLIYPFLEHVRLPSVPMFLGKYDLSQPNLLFNFIQSVLIFLIEVLHMYTSPYPSTRGQVVRMQLILPVVSFIIFLGLPAGKKLFIITTLLFSIVLGIYRAVKRAFADYKHKKESQTAAGEQVVVDVH